MRSISDLLARAVLLQKLIFTVKGVPVNNSSIADVILGSVWFKDMKGEMLDGLIDAAVIKPIKNGTYLYAKNEEADGLYAVLEGDFVVGVCSENGKRAVYAIIEPGGWLGELSLFDSQPRPSDAIARGNAQVLFISYQKIQALLDQNPQYYKYFIAILCEHYRSATRLVEANMMRSVPERLALRLLELSHHQGIPIDEEAPIRFKVSQEDLSYMAGSTRQRINQELKIWEKKGWIELSYGYVTVVDRKSLEGLLTLI